MRPNWCEGAALDSQSKQALREVRAVCVPSHRRSQRFDRRWKQRACHRVTSLSVEDVKRRRQSFDCFSQGRPVSCRLHRGGKPSIPVWAQKPAICSVKAAANKQRFTENENWNEIGWSGSVSMVEEQPAGGRRSPGRLLPGKGSIL